MTRLVFWYGVKFEDRGQAYSFVPAAKIMTYEEGEKKGFCEVPKKIKKKLNDKKKLTKTEEQISRGLKEITGDMKREKKDRIKWMMKFQEDWELPDQDEEEEDEVKSPELELKPKKVKKLKVEEIKAELEQPIKRKPGRPRKVDKEREERERSEKLAMLERAEKATKADKLEKATKADKPEKATKADKSSALQKTKKKSTAKKFVIIDEDQEFDEDSDDDNDDRSYNDNESSDDNADDAEESDGSDDSNRRLNKDKESRKRKADSDGKKAKKKSKSEISGEMGEDAVGKGMKKKTKSETSAEGKEDTDEKKVKKKPKSEMTEEEKEEQVIRERERQAMYRENRKRKKAEALGLEYVPGERLQAKKSKKKIWQEEQSRFAECEEIFIPIMEQLQECKDKPNVEGVLKCIGLLLDQVEMLTPPFLHSYSLGMLVKDVRKTFEGSNPAVKDQCKRLTNEMKRVYTDKEKDLPDDFVPKKRKKHASSKDGKKRESISDSDPPIIDDSTRRMKVESEVPTDPSYSHTDRPVEQTPQNNAEMSHVDQTPSADLPVSSVKLEMPKPSRQVFSLKGMFEKPKPTPKPKITPNVPVSGQLSYKPKTLPSWVTGPATKAEEFHEQHTKERNFALEFFVDAVSPSSSDKFDAVSVSRAFELAIFAETKLRGRDWKTYWEKVHDVVAMLSPGKNQSNAIMQGIIDGDYQDPSELVKLSRQEIHSLNQRRVK